MERVAAPAYGGLDPDPRGATVSTQTATDADIAVVRAGFEAFALGDAPTFAGLFASDATWNHRNPDRFGGLHQGREAILAFIGESAQLTAGTLRVIPESFLGDGEGRVAVQVRVSATRPDGRSFDDPQLLLFVLDGEQVHSVDQYVGDPPAVTAFWA
jgi:ketosteroid isomerase-like protein